MACYGCGMVDSLSSTAPISIREISATDYTMLEKLLNQPYYEFTSLKLPFQSEREKLIENAEELLLQTPQYLSMESEKDGVYYAVTNLTLGLHYYGETKNNRPDGFGVIKNGDMFIYAGEFDDGRYDGYGIEFHINSGYYFDDTSVCEEFARYGYIPQNEVEELRCYLENYALYEGNWKEGVRHGEGTLLRPDTYYLLSAAELKQFSDQSWVTVCYPFYVTTGTYKNGQWHGDVKEYKFDQLLYDGEYADGQRKGDGIEYHNNKEVKYDGGWDRGYYHGKGTLYDETGVEIYSGKWDHGNYAS